MIVKAPKVADMAGAYNFLADVFNPDKMYSREANQPVDLLRMYSGGRRPDKVMCINRRPYLYRWILRATPRDRLYFHVQVGGDQVRWLHDHPWFNTSHILYGGYYEEIPGWNWNEKTGLGTESRLCCQRNGLVLRRAEDPHRLKSIALVQGMDLEGPVVMMSLFATGPKVRNWGFYTDEGWKPYTEIVDPADIIE